MDIGLGRSYRDIGLSASAKFLGIGRINMDMGLGMSNRDIGLWASAKLLERENL